MSQRTLHRLVAILGIACVAVLVWATFASRGASVRPDELGFLLNGWVLTGHNELRLGDNFRSFYTAGYGFITGAAAVIGRGIDAQYRLSLLANIGLVAATAAALARFAFLHLVVSRRSARTLAVIVAITPAVAANSLFAWSETLNRLLFVSVALLAYEHIARPRWTTAIGLGATSSFMVIAHGRFTVVPALAVVVIAIVAAFGPRSRTAFTVAAIGVASALVSYFVFTRINVSLRRDLYPAASGKESRMVDKFTDLSNLPSIGRSFTGQLWYVLATSFGLTAVGLAMNVRAMVLGLRRPRNLQWLAPTFVFLAAGSVALASTLQVLRVIRPDHLVYGRYLEAVSPLFAMLGLTAVVSGSRFARRAWTAGVASIVLAAVILGLAAGRDELREMIAANGFFAIPNAIALDWPLKLTKPAGYLLLTTVFVAIAVVFIVTARKSMPIFLAALAAVSLGLTAFTAVRTVVPYRDYLDQMTLPDAIADVVAGSERDTVVMFDSGGLGGQLFFDYRYLLHPIQVDRADVYWIDRVPLRCVIGADARPPEDAGWEMVARENKDASRGRQNRGNIVLWMRTGVDSC